MELENVIAHLELRLDFAITDDKAGDVEVLSEAIRYLRQAEEQYAEVEAAHGE